MVGELDQIVRALGGGEQRLGTEFAEQRVPPARQRLDADDPAGRHRDLRLPEDLDPVLVEREPQIEFEPAVLGLPRLLALGEYRVRGGLAVARVGKREAGVAEQFTGVAVAAFWSARCRRAR